MADNSTPQEELSMEEILSSIKGILSEDAEQTPPPEQAPVMEATAAAEEDDDDVYDLSAAMIVSSDDNGASSTPAPQTDNLPRPPRINIPDFPSEASLELNHIELPPLGGGLPEEEEMPKFEISPSEEPAPDSEDEDISFETAAAKIGEVGPVGVSHNEQSSPDIIDIESDPIYMEEEDKYIPTSDHPVLAASDNVFEQDADQTVDTNSDPVYEEAEPSEPNDASAIIDNFAKMFEANTAKLPQPETETILSETEEKPLASQAEEITVTAEENAPSEETELQETNTPAPLVEEINVKEIEEAREFPPTPEKDPYDISVETTTNETAEKEVQSKPDIMPQDISEPETEQIFQPEPEAAVIPEPEIEPETSSAPEIEVETEEQEESITSSAAEEAEENAPEIVDEQNEENSGKNIEQPDKEIPASENENPVADVSSEIIDNFAQMFTENKTVPSVPQAEAQTKIGMASLTIEDMIKEVIAESLKPAIDQALHQVDDEILSMTKREISAAAEKWVDENLNKVIEDVVREEVKRVMAKVGS